MKIKPKIKKSICISLNLFGRKKIIKSYIDYIKKYKSNLKKKNVLIIGSSSGYGFISKLILNIIYKNNLITLSKEKNYINPNWCNTFILKKLTKLKCIKNINDDSFFLKTKEKIIKIIKKKIKKIDILIYSLAIEKKKDYTNKRIYKSYIKPIKKKYKYKDINIFKNKLLNKDIEKAKIEDLYGSLEVMGGKDWKTWINIMVKKNVISKNFTTIAYSYDGSNIIHPIYKLGTIGLTKKHMEKTLCIINKSFKEKIKAKIIINPIIITQSSLAIPGIKLYISILYKIFNAKNIQKNAINQMLKLFNIIHKNKNMKKTIININNIEKKYTIKNKLSNIYKVINDRNLNILTKKKYLKKEYLNLFGFNI